MKQIQSDWTPRDVTTEDILALASELNKHGIEYAIFGSIAMRIHGVERPTEDIDVYLGKSSLDPSTVINALKNLGWFPDATEEEWQSLIDSEAFSYGVIKVQGEIGIDLVTSMGEQSLDTLSTETKIFNGTPLRVITLEQLLEMKRNSLRERDQLDYQELINRMGKMGQSTPKKSFLTKLNFFSKDK